MNKVVTYTISGQMNQTKMSPAELVVMQELATKNSEVQIVKVETPRRRRSR